MFINVNDLFEVHIIGQNEEWYPSVALANHGHDSD